MDYVNVLVTTKHRGVWLARASKDEDLSGSTIANLKTAIMAIKWGTTNGVQQLANTGPTDLTKLSEPSDIHYLHDVTGVFSITNEAALRIWKSN